MASWPRRSAAGDLSELIGQAGFEVDELLERPAWLERQFGIYRSAAALVDRGDPAIADLAVQASSRHSAPA